MKKKYSSNLSAKSDTHKSPSKLTNKEITLLIKSPNTNDSNKVITKIPLILNISNSAARLKQYELYKSLQETLTPIMQQHKTSLSTTEYSEQYQQYFDSGTYIDLILGSCNSNDQKHFIVLKLLKLGDKAILVNISDQFQQTTYQQKCQRYFENMPKFSPELYAIELKTKRFFVISSLADIANTTITPTKNSTIKSAIFNNSYATCSSNAVSLKTRKASINPKTFNSAEPQYVKIPQRLSNKKFIDKSELEDLLNQKSVTSRLANRSMEKIDNSYLFQNVYLERTPKKTLQDKMESQSQQKEFRHIKQGSSPVNKRDPSRSKSIKRDPSRSKSIKRDPSRSKSIKRESKEKMNESKPYSSTSKNGQCQDDSKSNLMMKSLILQDQQPHEIGHYDLENNHGNLRANRLMFDYFQNGNKGFKEIRDPRTNCVTYFGAVDENSQVPDGNGVLFQEDGTIIQGMFQDGNLEGFARKYEEKGLILISEGYFRQNKINGYGKFYYPNGQKKLEGYFKEDFLNGEGTLWSEIGKKIYKGNFVNNMFEGAGKKFYQNKDFYQGNFTNGLRNGCGVMQSEDGSKIEGIWKDGKLKEKIKETGILRDENNRIQYKGDIKANKANGKGIQYMTNGDVYEGKFEDNVKHGKGVIKSRNDIIKYKGLFVNGVSNGIGKIYYDNGTVKSKGMFNKGRLHGNGKLYDNLGKCIYKGNWSEDKKDGFGVYYYAGDERYEGYWKNDKKYGIGKYFNKYGDYYEGLWVNDKFDEKGKFVYKNGKWSKNENDLITKKTQYNNSTNANNKGSKPQNCISSEKKELKSNKKSLVTQKSLDPTTSPLKTTSPANDKSVIKRTANSKKNNLITKTPQKSLILSETEQDIFTTENLEETIFNNDRDFDQTKSDFETQSNLQTELGGNFITDKNSLLAYEESNYFFKADSQKTITKTHNSHKGSPLINQTTHENMNDVSIEKNQEQISNKSETPRIYKSISDKYIEDKADTKNFKKKPSNTRYEGRIKNGKKHGLSVVYYENGEIEYEGNLFQDEKSGKGKCFFKDGNVYEGEWTNNKRNGKGKLIYKNADTYEGDWVMDIKEGFGVYIFAYGDKYEGYWKDGVRSGQGVYTYNCRTRYEGIWKDGDKNGYGKYFSKVGFLEYEGNWVNGNKQGEGIYYYDNGDCYKGKWENGFKSIEGCYIFHDGDRYEGQWKLGKKEGFGVYYCKNKDVYRGQWANDFREGQGTYAYNDGDFYDGQWKNGVKCGYGKFRFSEGNVYEGYWKDDKRNGLGVYYYSNLVKCYEGEWCDDMKNGRGIGYDSKGNVDYEGIWNKNKKKKVRK